MKIPYNRVHTCGDIVFAARGGKIHSFSLSDGGKHLSTWQHPDVAKLPETELATQPQEPCDEPPAKRQKLQDEQASGGAKDEASDEAKKPEPPEDDVAIRRKKKNNKSKRKGHAEHDAKHGTGCSVARVPDRPVLVQLVSSMDGRHVVAVSGHDKVIWVFEHCGLGTLALASQRTMPKRPSAICISPDSTIICADKFGDVYALPLIHTPPCPATATPPPPRFNSKPLVPAANSLTVHSKRNLEALENQRKQLEIQQQHGTDAASAAATSNDPHFDLSLLLGHVSMLTSLALGETQGRRYILTADRDEHIRVSRYLPQAHIIENFCLGHKEFVSAISIPPSKPAVLISGGGDDDIFVWDWQAGKLLSKASLLSLVREVAPDTASVTLCGLFCLVWPSASGPLTYIVAVCEDVKAIFSWQLTNANTLNHPGIIQLSGNPLHLAIFAPDTETPRLVVAQDPGHALAKSLLSFTLTMDHGRLASQSELSFDDEEIEASEKDAHQAEIRALLYTVSHLRKQASGNEADHGTDGASETQAGEIQT